MTTYGGGMEDGNGDVVLPNDHPDTQECTRYDDDIMKCILYFTEYCGNETSNHTSLPSACKVGDWLMTYTVESVLVLDGSTCPEAPIGFCDDPFTQGRKLQEDEKGEAILCPFMKKMN